MNSHLHDHPRQSQNLHNAPPWRIAEWLNAPQPLTLESLRGRVVVMLAFQMLCPGCVAHALPLATRAHQLFAKDKVAVLGLHTVFEHHEAMTPLALKAFLHEYRVPFPVAVDQPAQHGPVPETMRGYTMRGTPTWLLFDGEGRLRQHVFGEMDGLRLGAEIMALLSETPALTFANASPPRMPDNCDDDACAAPGSSAVTP
jgi:peroxiredoxin